MSRFRMLLLASAAIVIGACSDTQSPSTPSAGDELVLELDESASAAVEEDAADIQAGGAQLGTGGRGKGELAGVNPQVISCVSNAFHQLCTDIRNGRLRAANGDAVSRRNLNRTRGQLRINGFLVAFTNRFGPIFVGDEIFARYRGLNIRLFRGDRICHQWAGGAAPQVCGVVR